MSGMRAKAAYIVATKDRPGELRRLFQSLEAQTRFPDEVIVVDGGRESVEPLCRSARAFPVRYLRSLPPSAARQRNLGLAAVGPEADFVGFLDDDVVLESSAVAEMSGFWESAGDDIAGAAFTMRNHPALAWPSVKRTTVAEMLGLYCRREGAVSKAGFQTMIGQPRTTVYADWLPSGASVWRKDIFSRFRFDEWFRGYGYLEDLDFSYRVGKAFRLAVVAGAGYCHLPAAEGRGSGFEFGVREVLNRVYFVRKNPELSLVKCYMALTVRLAMNMALIVQESNFYFLGRAWGNLIGLARTFGRLPAVA
jgi:GT2 family glycosyltransferase